MLQNTIFRETERFVSIAQRSVFPYTLRAMTAWLANVMNLPGKMDRALAEEDSPGLVEEIPS